MATKKKGPAVVLVTVRKGKNSMQAFTFSIDKPGPSTDETRRERYSSASNARRAARRMLAASYNDEYGYWECQVGIRWYRIEWKLVDRSKRKTDLHQ